MSLLAVHRDAALMISFLYGVGLALASLPGSVSWYHLKHRPSAEKSENRSSNAALLPDARLVARRSIVFSGPFNS